MPYIIKKTPHCWGVFNRHKKIWKSYNTSKTKAQSQYKLLNYVGYIKGEKFK